MSQKRQQREEGNSDKRQKRPPTFKSVVMDVMMLQRLQNLMEPVLEPLIRRVVKEEMDSALRKYIISMKRNCGKDVEPSDSRSLQLQFLNAISLPVFSGARIEAEGFTTMKIALVDSLNGQVVSSGLGSSAKVELVVLEGDFDSDIGHNWTFQEFKNNIVRERENKKRLLTGDVSLTLKDGTGFFGDVLFTDNSSWTRSRKFRLGARVVDNLGGVRVREARSEPFVVRDHRGELYKKHHPPVLGDEVWRLEKIGKDGAFHKRLSKERVYTVQDFLMLLSLNPTKLRHILGTGMSTKSWEVTAEHARTCVLDNKLFLYNNTLPKSQQRNGAVFNVVGHVTGMYSNDRYVSYDKLSETEKADARALVISAFEDREQIVTLDNESSLNMQTPSCLSDSQSSSKFMSEVFHHQDLNNHKIGRLLYSQYNTSTPDYTHSIYPIRDFDDYLHDIDLTDITNDQPLIFHSEVADFSDIGSMSQDFSTNEHLHYFERDCSPQNPDLELSGDLQNVINYNAFSPIDQFAKGWNILLCVLKWCFSIKRIVARKTHGKHIELAIN